MEFTSQQVIPETSAQWDVKFEQTSQNAFPLVPISIVLEGETSYRRVVIDLAARRRVADGIERHDPSFFSGRGGLLASQDPQEPQAIRLYDLALGRDRGRLLKPDFFGSALHRGCFSPDGAILVAQESDQGNLWLWDTNRGRPLTYLPQMCKPRWSQDGQYLIAVDRPTVPRKLRVYRVDRDTPTYRSPTPIRALMFSDDGSRLVANDHVWKVITDSNSTHLRAETAKPGAADIFVSSGRRQWTVRPSFPNSFEDADAHEIFVEQTFP